MPSSNVCWGIEVGAGAIKALKLERSGESVRVTDWLVVPHKKPLSTPDVDQADALRVGLGTFIAERPTKGATVAVSVPGHMGFTRFAKLPPVDPKKVPDIVKFEAVQQIPFPIEQVEWDYQTFASPDSPDVEVGIFAITRERVMERLALLADVRLPPQVVALSPVAVYNALAYDLSFTEKTLGTVILDVGTVSTDLIVADAGRVWIRTFPIGGHHFTDRLVSAFKLTYPKAEKLKREVEQSQHKRQVFQAMRPVFEDLATDVQRSMAYYQQLHPESKLTRLVGLGATFGLPGLKKFLSQRLQIDVVRLEQFHRISVEGASSAEFQSHAHEFCTAYGCALQALGLAPIDANLVPVSVVRTAMWKRKIPWFATAAALSIAGGAAAFIKPALEGQSIPGPRAESQAAVRAAVDRATKLKGEWTEVNKSTRIGSAVANLVGLFESREVAARLIDDLGQMLATANPQPELLAGGPEAQKIAPKDWRWLELKTFRVQAPGDASADAAASATAQSGGGRRGGRGAAEQQGAAPGGDPGAAGGGRVIPITLVVETPNAEGIRFVNSTIVKWLEANKERPGSPYKIIPPEATKITKEPVAGPQAGAGAPAAAGGGGSAAPALSASLETLAPLPKPSDAYPAGAEVFRYTIHYGIEVVAGGVQAPGAGAGGAEGPRPADSPPPPPRPAPPRKKKRVARREGADRATKGGRA